MSSQEDVWCLTVSHHELNETQSRVLQFQVDTPTEGQQKNTGVECQCSDVDSGQSVACSYFLRWDASYPSRWKSSWYT